MNGLNTEKKGKNKEGKTRREDEGNHKENPVRELLRIKSKSE